MPGLSADDRLRAAGGEPSQVPLADPVAEALRLISAAAASGLLMRTLGGVAICLQAPDGRPRLPRSVKDIDVAVPRGAGRAAGRVLRDAGYLPDEMFNSLRGDRRQLHYDTRNERHLDVFVGEFSLCHQLPIAARLDREPLTIPLEELLLTKLQVVHLTENDRDDIYSLLVQHEVTTDGTAGIDPGFIAHLCARDWGLWRTCQLNIERSLDGLDAVGLEPAERQTVRSRMESLRRSIDAEPKSRRWQLRNRVGDRVRWYEVPEEERAAGD